MHLTIAIIDHHTRHLMHQCIKAIVIVSTGLITLSCVSAPSADSLSGSASVDSSFADSVFVPQNADGHPELVVDNENLSATINQKLIALYKQWQCPEGGDSYFNIERHSLSKEFLSIEYSALSLCKGNPSYTSAGTGLTFSMSNGEEVGLESLTQCNSIEEVKQKISISELKTDVKDCPNPEFSGDYFIDKNTVTLMNFYPFHLHAGCEFTIVKDISDLACK